MFVRLKRVRSYRYLQLVESVRSGDKPRQRVLATLGRVEQLQAEGSIDALVRSLSRFSPTALALIAGESNPVEGGLIAAEKRRIETPFSCAWIFFRPSR
jgi:hypothetical protein